MMKELLIVLAAGAVLGGWVGYELTRPAPAPAPSPQIVRLTEVVKHTDTVRLAATGRYRVLRDSVRWHDSTAVHDSLVMRTLDAADSVIHADTVRIAQTDTLVRLLRPSPRLAAPFVRASPPIPAEPFARTWAAEAGLTTSRFVPDGFSVSIAGHVEQGQRPDVRVWVTRSF